MNPSDTTNSASKKLTLTKETLRQLTTPELQLAAGGLLPYSSGIYNTLCISCCGCH
jgi:hypothetical protein